ncbi:hypothetical protein ACROSR_14035 [Roseovarius tibetensis]
MLRLVWFYSSKLRIQKIAAKAIRDRPLTSLFWMGGVGSAMDLDSVV